MNDNINEVQGEWNCAVLFDGKWRLVDNEGVSTGYIFSTKPTESEVVLVERAYNTGFVDGENYGRKSKQTEIANTFQSVLGIDKIVAAIRGDLL